MATTSRSRYGGGRTRNQNEAAGFRDQRQHHILSPNPLLGYRRLPTRVMLKKEEPIIREGARDIVKKWERDRRVSLELSTPDTGPITTSSMGLTDPSPDRGTSTTDERGVNQHVEFLSDQPSERHSPSLSSPAASPSSSASSSKPIQQSESQIQDFGNRDLSDLRQVLTAAEECVATPSTHLNVVRDVDAKQDSETDNQATITSTPIPLPVDVSQPEPIDEAQTSSNVVLSPSDSELLEEDTNCKLEYSLEATSASKEDSIIIGTNCPPEVFNQCETEVTSGTTLLREDSAVIGVNAPPHSFVTSPTDVQLDDDEHWNSTVPPQVTDLPPPRSTPFSSSKPTFAGCDDSSAATSSPGEDPFGIQPGAPPAVVLDNSISNTPIDEKGSFSSSSATSSNNEIDERPIGVSSPYQNKDIIDDEIVENCSNQSEESFVSSDLESEVTSEPAPDFGRYGSQSPPGFSEIHCIPSNVGVVTRSPSCSSSDLSSTASNNDIITERTEDEENPNSQVFGLVPPLPAIYSDEFAASQMSDLMSSHNELSMSGTTVGSGSGIMTLSKRSSSRKGKYRAWSGEDYRGVERFVLQRIEPSRLLFESWIHVQNRNPVAALFTAMNAAVLYSCGSNNESHPLVLIMSTMETLNAMRTNNTSPTPTLSLIVPILKIVWSVGRNL